MKKNTRNTLIFVIIILVVASGLFYYQRVITKKPVDYAVITTNAKEVARLPLDEDTTMKVESPDGGYNLVEIKDGTICVTESDCENQICVSQGQIHESYELIVCLPHAMVITIEESK